VDLPPTLQIDRMKDDLRRVREELAALQNPPPPDLDVQKGDSIDVEPSRLTTDELELSDSSAFSLPASERARLESQI
jgi:hypothetical protein